MHVWYSEARTCPQPRVLRVKLRVKGVIFLSFLDFLLFHAFSCCPCAAERTRGQKSPPARETPPRAHPGVLWVELRGFRSTLGRSGTLSAFSGSFWGSLGRLFSSRVFPRTHMEAKAVPQTRLWETQKRSECACLRDSGALC